MRKIGLGDAPVLRDERPVLRVLDVAGPGELVRLLPVLAPPLAVALTGDRAVALALGAELTRGQHEVDDCESVLDAETLMFDAARVERHRPLGAPPHRTDALDERGLDSADIGHALRGVGADDVADRLPTDRVVGDVGLVEQAVPLDHVEHAVEERRVGSRPQRHEHVGGASEGRLSRVEDDELGTPVAGAPDVVRHDREAFGHVRAGHEDDVRVEDVGPWVGGPVDPERLLVRAAELTMHRRPL